MGLLDDGSIFISENSGYEFSCQSQDDSFWQRSHKEKYVIRKISGLFLEAVDLTLVLNLFVCVSFRPLLSS